MIRRLKTALAGLIVLGCVVLPAAAQNTQSALTALITNTMPDNTVGTITPLINRNALTSMVLSSTCPVAGQILTWNAISIPTCVTGTATQILHGGTAPFFAAISNADFTPMAAFTQKCNPTSATAVPQDCNGYPHNARDFGATGDGATNDTTALQNCINAAQTTHTGCYIPAGRYVITAPLSITSHIHLFGDGYQSSAKHAYIPCCGVANLTAAEVINATTLMPASTTNAINIATNDAVQVDMLQIAYVTQPAALSGIAGITVTGAASGTCNFTRIEDVMIAGADRGISVTDCVQWTINRVYFYNHISYGILVNSTSAIPSSDWLISNNTFLSGSATTLYHISLSGQGGGRLIGNKLNSGGSINATVGVLVNPTVNTGLSIEPLVITGNSIEGVNVGIQLYGASISAGSSSTQIMITGNQFWNNVNTGHDIEMVAAAGPAMWISGVTITGNFFNQQGAGGTNIVIDGAQNVNVVGNTFDAITSSTAFSIGATTGNVHVCSNLASSRVTLTESCMIQQSTSDAAGATYQFFKNRAGGNSNSGDSLGLLDFRGFANGAQQQSVTVKAAQNGAASGSNIPSQIQLLTSNTSGQLNQTFTMDNKGHIAIVPSASPTLTAGCNGAGSAVSGSNVYGTVTGSTAAATTCTLTFANSGFTATPNCVVSGLSSPLTGAITPSTTTLVVNFGSTANYKFTWACFGL